MVRVCLFTVYTVVFCGSLCASNTIKSEDLRVFETHFTMRLDFELDGGVFSFCFENNPAEAEPKYLRLDNVGKMTSAWSMSHRWFLKKLDEQYIEETDRLIKQQVEQKAAKEKISYSEAYKGYMDNIKVPEVVCGESPDKKRKEDPDPIVPLKYLYRDFSFSQPYALAKSQVLVTWCYSQQSAQNLTDLNIFPEKDDLFVYIQNCFQDKMKSIAKELDKNEMKMATGKYFG